MRLGVIISMAAFFKGGKGECLPGNFESSYMDCSNYDYDEGHPEVIIKFKINLVLN